MLPRVVRLTRFDTYRDGGSISASFESDDKSEYTLLFKIDLRRSAHGDESKRCYKSAFLEKHSCTEYKSPITGVVSPDWKHESGPVSWNEARTLLEEIKPKVKGFVSDYIHVFEQMLNAAARDGN